MPKFDLPARPGQFSIVVPEHWATFDISHEPLTAARRKAMAAAKSGKERETIDDFFMHAKRVTTSARKTGAIWGAGTAAAFDDGFFIGQVMLFAVASPSPDTFTTHSMASELGGGRRSSGSDLPPRIIKPVQLEDGLMGTRICSQEDTQITDSQTVRVIASHTFVPVPGGQDEYILITGVSPNTALEEEVHDLFDAIAGTFRFLPE